MSLKKPAHAKVSPAPKKSAAAPSTSAKQSIWSRSQMTGAGIVAAAICITVAAIAIGAHESSPGSEAVTSEVAAPAVTAQVASKKLSSPEASATESPAVVGSTETAVKTSGLKAVPATIAGCLQRSDETFKLTDTDGVDVPKARSWKTGFLKKGSASVEVVDAGNHARLANHVGRRVSVTGMLTDRQMQVRSVRRISATCN